MKFPTDRPVKVVMLGAGGTGGYVAPYVFRLLHMLDRPARFVVCDGDIVEPKNLDRQNFVPADLGENKARVLAERYSTVLGMETEYVPSFIEKLPDLMELIEPKEWELNPYSTKRTKEMVLLLGCVDNNKTRQLCHQAFHQSEELIYIDSGNGKYTGQVVCGVRRNGRTIRRSIGGVHPEMLKDTDLFPSEISCAEAAQEDPQSNLVLDDAVDVQGCCRKAEELFELYQRCANRKQIETICVNFLRGMEATKLSVTGHMYFVPRTFMERVDIFEDFITLLSGLNKKQTPLVVNSFYIIDDAKQRDKMTEEFYLAVKKEIAAYQEKCDYLIKSSSQSPAVMERWVLKVQALEEKKRHYEGVLQRELDGLDDEFSVLKLLSQELQVRANGIRNLRFQQRAA